MKQDVIGKLSGFDRLMIRGTRRALANMAGMMTYLSYMGVLLKDFGLWEKDGSKNMAFRMNLQENRLRKGNSLQFR